MKPVLAVFDFDGTLTKRDVLPSFLIAVFGRWTTFYKFLRLLPAFLGYLLSDLMLSGQAHATALRRQGIKEKVLTQFFQGINLNELAEYAEAFAHSESLKKLISPSALERIAWHQKQQHCCVIVSAAADLYLVPCGKALGIRHLISSRLEQSAQGMATGRLVGVNCWGQEKIRRLEEAFGPLEQYLIYAYGDSRGDRELLAQADYAYYKTMPKVCK
jgi:phosphatidylglycerophosphatase C